MQLVDKKLKVQAWLLCDNVMFKLGLDNFWRSRKPYKEYIKSQASFGRHEFVDAAVTFTAAD